MRALFVGNSFTARNDVPGMIAQLAQSCGEKLEHVLVSAGGASLRRHWNKGDAQLALTDDPFDVVVLQEQSTLPVKNANRMFENVRLFDEAIRAAGARTVLYMTWARQHEPQNQRVIAEAYTTIGAELRAKVAPVGLAWERFIAAHTTPPLHDKDRSHPTLAGSYLAACVLFSVLFDRSPVGLAVPATGLSADDAHAIQRAAGEP
ncbi:MAG: SGNH/GDSL hydrolase family protein [Blastocatellia bacterium]|nr:SGNH/GDSL hydrolase family protein [Blastocatellia bacterium]